MALDQLSFVPALEAELADGLLVAHGRTESDSGTRIVRPRPRTAPDPSRLPEDDRRAARRNHEHAVVGAQHFVVEVDTDHRRCPELAGSFDHFVEGGLAGVRERVLVGAGAPADNVADAREQVAEDVRADDCLTGDDAEIPSDGMAFDAGGGGDDHDISLVRAFERQPG